MPESCASTATRTPTTPSVEGFTDVVVHTLRVWSFGSPCESGTGASPTTGSSRARNRFGPLVSGRWRTWSFNGGRHRDFDPDDETRPLGRPLPRPGGDPPNPARHGVLVGEHVVRRIRP